MSEERVRLPGSDPGPGLACALLMALFAALLMALLTARAYAAWCFCCRNFWTLSE